MEEEQPTSRNIGTPCVAQTPIGNDKNQNTQNTVLLVKMIKSPLFLMARPEDARKKCESPSQEENQVAPFRIPKITTGRGTRQKSSQLSIQALSCSVPATEEPPNSHARTEHHSRKTATDDGRAESDVEHLHAVAALAALDEAVRVVGARELPALGDGHFEELAQRAPAFAHLVLEQVLGGDERADLLVVFLETALAVLLEVAFPEFGPEFCACVSFMLLLFSRGAIVEVMFKTYC